MKRPVKRGGCMLAAACALLAGCVASTPRVAAAAVVEAAVEPEPQDPVTWEEALERYGSRCPGPLFRLPQPLAIDAADRRFLLEGSTLRLEGGPWKGALKIGVLGAIKDADHDTRENIKRAAREFKKLGVHVVLANGDLVGDETGDLAKVVRMLGEEFTVPVLAHSGNYEWTTAFTEAIASNATRWPHLFNMNLIRDVDLGGVHIVSLPGWSNRRYVKSAACWYGEDDVAALRSHASELVERGEVVILTAHGPPRGRGKQSIDFAHEAGNVGDESLTDLLVEVPVPFGIFSHILESGGRATTDPIQHKPLRMPMKQSASRLYVNVGSASSFGWEMLDGRTSRGMAAVFVVDQLAQGGRARVTFLKLR